MATGFRIDFLWYQVGQGDFLHAFFLPYVTGWKKDCGEVNTLI